MSRFRVLVSAQNNRYCAWLTLVFANSVRKHFDRPAIMAVHAREGEPLLGEFRLAASIGAELVRCPDYERRVGHVPYCCRNAPGALLSAPVDAEFVVLCDPDMVFTAPVAFDELGAAPGRPTMDKLSYMSPKHRGQIGWLDDACAREGIPVEELRGRDGYGGVPHVIHASDVGPFAREWLDAIDLFENTRSEPCRMPWLACIWAQPIALRRLGMDVEITDLSFQNLEGVAWDGGGRPVLHYCQGDAVFEKRWFHGDDRAREVWDVRPLGRPCASDRVRAEIEDTAEHFGLGDPDQRRRLLGW